MRDTEAEPNRPTRQPPHRRRWWPWVLGALAVLVAAGGVVVWQLTRPPAPVSVPHVLHRYRTAEPSGTATHPGGPPRGVYLYATTGWERISAGNLTHHYPSRTTVTVTDTACGLRIRWDALAGRWAQGDLCLSAGGWRLQHYIDAHKFLYRQDLHEYSCSGYPVIVCRTDGDVLTSTVEQLAPHRVRITQRATGASVSTGVIDAWLLPNGLPRRVVLSDHGAQTVLGARITYTESATFTLTSATPLR